jgi:hypothetical protein
MSRKLRILLSVILLMVVTVIFYQLSHTATDNETNTSSFHLSNRKHFMQINETLSILNKELQLMYRQQTQEIQSPNQVLNQMLPIELIDTATSTATRIPASVAELIEKHLFEMNSASPTLEKISLRIGIKDTKQVCFIFDYAVTMIIITVKAIINAVHCQYDSYYCQNDYYSYLQLIVVV